MKTFNDSKGNPWSLTLTFDSIKRVRELVQVDLLKLLDGDNPLLSQLSSDIETLINVVFALVKPAADKQTPVVSDADFAALLGGEQIYAAREAFWAELSDFYRSLQDQPTLKAIQTQTALVNGMMKKAELKLGMLDVEATVEAVSGKAFGSLPELLVFHQDR